MRRDGWGLHPLRGVGDRSRSRELGVEPAEELRVGRVVVGVLLAATQREDAHVRVREGVEDAVVPSAEAVERAAEALELFLSLASGVGSSVRSTIFSWTRRTSFGGSASHSARKLGFRVSNQPSLVGANLRTAGAPKGRRKVTAGSEYLARKITLGSIPAT